MRHHTRRGRTGTPDGLGEVLFELVPMGSVVKVSAIDPVTGTEVSMVGDPNLNGYSLRAAARRKLAYVIARNRKTTERVARPSRPGDVWA